MVFPKIPVLDKTSWLKIASHYVFDGVGSLGMSWFEIVSRRVV